ncbi:ABC transporter permease [Devosia soli]|uniref:ABC transporter permease n=1 Tax=Devosia soli TaxID=361041 RepID=A0A0F5LJH5_9HYPH|nr:ABC transporter permease [Devosia soli]KKB82531.1 ABC transporter permease [Devosia soli]
MAQLLSSPSDLQAARVPRLDKLGIIIAVLVLAAVFFLPFVISRPNRIVAGMALPISGALPALQAIVLYGLIALGSVIGLLRVPSLWRLASSFVVVLSLCLFLGGAANFLTPEGNTVARVSPGAGFWVLVFAFALIAADALVRLRLGPLARIGVLLLVAAAIAAMLWAGVWQNLSILKEYANRGAAFWAEARTHVALAFGSLAVATVIGVPVGILCYRRSSVRAALLPVLNMVQTIPSIALFGLLIAPLAWLAANVPGASAVGISGIGTAPAMIALFAYSLLPIVSNTVIGLDGVDASVKDAARGMGMTDNQVLFGVELPLAFPVILTGIRIVLVQNIGLATIAALIGGGGFGVFVFQGIGQTAMDLVLLGAVPTVALAFVAAVVLDALVELVSPKRVPSA